MINRKRRVSSIDKLPLKEVQWAYDRVLEGRRDQTDIVKELNDRLASLDIKSISVSAFSRWVERIRDGEIHRPRAINGEKPADDLLTDLNLSTETHAAFKVFLSLYARDVRALDKQQKSSDPLTKTGEVLT